MCIGSTQHTCGNTGNSQEQVLSFHLWVLRIKLELLGLAAGVVSWRAILPARIGKLLGLEFTPHTLFFPVFQTGLELAVQLELQAGLELLYVLPRPFERQMSGSHHRTPTRPSFQLREGLAGVWIPKCEFSRGLFLFSRSCLPLFLLGWCIPVQV